MLETAGVFLALSAGSVVEPALVEAGTVFAVGAALAAGATLAAGAATETLV